MAYNQDDLDRLEKYIKLQQESSKNLKSFGELYETISELKRTSIHLEKEAKKIKEESKKLTQEIKDLEASRNSANSADIDKQIKAKKKEKIALKSNYKLAKKNSEEAKILGKHLAENLNTQTLTKAVLGSTLGVMKDITKTIYEQRGYLYDQQKAVKMTELQMGILSKQSRSFRDNIYQSGLYTNQLGVDVKAISEMQATYSSDIGRAVELTQEGNIAMAELAAGTILGQENAARFAANMDTFAISVEASRDFMEESLNLAHKMGLNGAKFTAKLEDSLRIAQTYNFKNGIEGTKKMAANATKLKIELDSAVGMADKVFNPEGAIEMAASLSVLGGAWSQMGDPFQLMFKARNDMAGFIEDIGKAAASTASFNKVTGEVDIESMELHRLREVAKVTGISLSELTATAREAAKFSEIEMNITGNFDDDIKEFISSKAKYNKTKKQFSIQIENNEVFIDELHNFNKNQLRNLVKEQASLKERALQSKTFDEQWDNLVNQFKTTLLPGFGRFTDALLKGLVGFQDYLADNKVLENFATIGKHIGEFGASIAKLIIENPIKAAIAVLLGKAAIWAARGRLLGMGFNSVANVGRPGGAGGSAGGASGSGSKMYAKGLKAGGIAAGVGLAATIGRSFMDNPDSEGGKALGMGGSVLTGAGTGAMIGSMFGPIGTAVGGIAGGAFGAYQGYQDNYAQPAQSTQRGLTSEAQDFVSRPGAKPIKFSSADTLVGMKKGGGIDNFLSKTQNTTKTSGGKMEINFIKPLKIEGSIDLKGSGGNSASIDLNNPHMIRAITRLIQEELSTSLNGKMSATPTT